MSTRYIALSGTLLAIVFLAHAAGRITQIGGAQVAPSIAIYVLMALLIAPRLPWGALAGIALAIGFLTSIATSSPFPPANYPAHGVGFLVACAFAKAWSASDTPLNTAQIILTLTVTLLTSWTLFAVTTWFGLTGSPFTEQAFTRFNLPLGQGLAAWWLAGFLAVAIPTWIIGIILTPLLYRAVRPALVRQGLLAA
ncbi:MAG: hypothetical protein ACKVVP_24050 [Chloroflexota bacterium]